MGRVMTRSCRANGCHPVGSVFLLCNRSFTISTTLLPANGTPSWISSLRAVHALSHLRCSIKRLALACTVLGTVSTTSASIPLLGSPPAPSTAAPAPAPGPGKADRKYPLCPSPNCCCSKMLLLLAMGVLL